MLLLSPFALVEVAEAACGPASPVNNTIVTCSGTTNNQNDPNGFGTTTDTGNTINVQTGAIVTGTQFGIEASTTTISNSGTIGSTDPNGAAVHAATAEVNNNNNGRISSPSFGVQTSGAATINNSGTIESTARIAIFAGSANIDNSGSILAPTAQSALSTPGLATVKNSGLFVGGSNALFSSGGAVNVTENTGTIRATDAGGHAINASTTASVANSAGGIIEANGLAGVAIQANGVDVTNAGAINATGGVAITSLGSNAIVRNSGSVTAASSAVQSSTDVAVTNSGTMQTNGADGETISAFGNMELTNSGTISATGAGSTAIAAGIANNAVANVTNASTGLIEGAKFGVGISGSTTVANAGTIRATADQGAAISAFGGVFVTNVGTIEGTGATSAGVIANGAIAVGNTSGGLITATGLAIASLQDSVNITNAGTLQATAADGIAVRAATTATVTNAGTIQGTGANGSAIFANGLVTATNFGLGTISGTKLGISSALDAVDITNVGMIAATAADGNAIQAATTAKVNNSGTIQSAGAAGFGIRAAAVDATNSGRIRGNTGIFASGAGGVGSAITNSGTIAGTGGTAIRLSPAADTLTLLLGSQIIGAIDMGGGADTINIVNNVPVISRVSSFFRLLSANALNIINFTGTINTAAVTVDTGGMPAVQTADGIATLDPTAFGQADRTLMDFTGGISSLVQGRLGGTAANVSAMQVVSFAPTSASGRTNEAFAAISALAYGPQHGAATAGGRVWSPADAPYNVWTSGFGGARAQKGDNLMLRTTSSAWGAAIGLDRQVRSDLLVGAFVSGGTGQLSTELNSQSIDTDYLGGGVYGRFDWARYFLDVTVQVGVNHNKSRRLVLNSLAPGGSESAIASYNGWYVSPEIAFGLRYAFDSGYTLTPVVRLRYLAGAFDEYSETGSVQNLSVGRRMLHDIEERAQVELSKITGVVAGALRTSVHGGLIALQRLGTPTIDTVMIGQSLSFTAPGKDSAAGVVTGVGFDLRAARNVSLFGAFETTVMSDRSRTAAAKGGLRVMF